MNFAQPSILNVTAQISIMAQFPLEQEETKIKDKTASSKAYHVPPLEWLLPLL
jgi:hypothetical protein